jgi:murein DD-endopeptidase MepM/ murein hydrolase activator NlpD
VTAAPPPRKGLVRILRRASLSLLATLVLVAGTVAPASAETKLEQAQREAKELQRDLDAATRKLQAIRNDLEKVEDQLGAAQESAKSEKRAMEAARRAVSNQAASMYRSSGGAGMLVPLLEDGENFVQRMELVDRVFERQSNVIQDARQAAKLYEEAVKRIKAAAAEREKLLESARAEQERIDRKFKAIGRTIDQLGGPVVRNGIACPVGRPRSFIDSWGFARSGGRRHQGTDIMAPTGTPLYAPASGTIIDAGQGGSLGGIIYWLRDDEGTAYYGAHLSQVLVSTGQRVTAGQLIGRVGSTGNASASGPHLHFERHPGGRGAPAVNPYGFVLSACS